MVGSLADILLKKALYKNQMEQLLAQFVFPEFSSAHGHLRARACWVLQHFCNIRFNEETILAEAINLTQRSLLTDSELPVKVLISICYVSEVFSNVSLIITGGSCSGSSNVVEWSRRKS